MILSLIAVLLNLLHNNCFNNSQCLWQYKTPFKNGSAKDLCFNNFHKKININAKIHRNVHLSVTYNSKTQSDISHSLPSQCNIIQTLTEKLGE